ncbi:uncharacterized protein METZ01_LOCUS154391 [marine metagenome]|uniref:Uncharacterized protein n=1 Tax=marine metagenome TaxID=408172 RepID=A0A382AKM6_9ZZZZ
MAMTVEEMIAQERRRAKQNRNKERSASATNDSDKQNVPTEGNKRLAHLKKVGRKLNPWYEYEDKHLTQGPPKY